MYECNKYGILQILCVRGTPDITTPQRLKVNITWCRSSASAKPEDMDWGLGWLRTNFCVLRIINNYRRHR